MTTTSTSIHKVKEISIKDDFVSSEYREDKGRPFHFKTIIIETEENETIEIILYSDEKIDINQM